MLLSRLAPVLTLLGALVAWEVICTVFSVPTFVLPRPSQIVTSALEVPLNTWLVNIAATLQIVLAGFFISFAIAIPLAMVLVNSRQLSNTVVPLLVVIQSTPIVAIAPILGGNARCRSRAACGDHLLDHVLPAGHIDGDRAPFCPS